MEDMVNLRYNTANTFLCLKCIIIIIIFLSKIKGDLVNVYLEWSDKG